MTILATHFSLVLGAWRLRVRIDIDEPREERREREEPASRDDWAASPPAGYATRGRG
jgi:hypothetical protein